MYLDPQHWMPPTSPGTKSGRAGSANNLKGTNKDINIIKLLKNNIPCKGKGIIVYIEYFLGRRLHKEPCQLSSKDINQEIVVF